MTDAIAIANFFIKKGIDTQEYVTPMKLQKLIYFSHGWSLALYNEPLIDSEVQAWEFGPVVPRVYECIKHYGNKPILRIIDYYGSTPEVSDSKTISFLELMWGTYSHFNALQLSEITHQADSPWDIVARKYNYDIPYNKGIPDSSIKEYFVKEKEKFLTHA
jgi:uncharacterized phage-associated protein